MDVNIVEATSRSWLERARSIQRTVLPHDNERLWATLGFRDVDTIYVAVRDGAAVGYVWADRCAPDLLVIQQIGVAPGHQHRGVGTALLLHVASEAAGCGEISDVLIKPMPGESYERLEAAYRRRGFDREAHAHLAGTPAAVCAAIGALG